MAEVLCVYREVKFIKEAAAAAKQEPSDAVAIVSYDEKPGIQAIATTAPDLPPQPGSTGPSRAIMSKGIGWMPGNLCRPARTQVQHAAELGTESIRNQVCASGN